MPTYTVRVSKANFSKLIARAERGEEVIIARGKTPVARLLPLDLPAHIRRQLAFGMFKGQFKAPDSTLFDRSPDTE